MAKKKMNIESSVSRLEEIVRLIDDENTSLEESVKLYKEGVDLSVDCALRLSKIEQEITELKKMSDNSFKEVSFKDTDLSLKDEN